jgi:hypothetical protein
MSGKAGYRLDMPFHNKYVHARPVLQLAGRHIKPYHITRQPDTELTAAIVDAAYAMAEHLLAPPDNEIPPASWLVLHEGLRPMYLCVYDWVWGNAVEVVSAAAAEPYLGCPDDDPAHFVPNTRILAGCVWELTLLEHERAAWVRHMLAPDEPDLGGYLADVVPDGPVGIQRHALGPVLAGA